MAAKPTSTAKPFSAITLQQICPICGKPFPTRDAWLLHVGIAHIEYATRLLAEAKLDK